MEKKLLLCAVLICSFLLHSTNGDRLIKQCVRDVKLRGCSDEICLRACKKAHPKTLQAAYCLEEYDTCQCYVQCNKPPYEDCWYRKKLPGCGIDNCDDYCSKKHYSPSKGTSCESPNLCACHIPC